MKNLILTLSILSTVGTATISFAEAALEADSKSSCTSKLRGYATATKERAGQKLRQIVGPKELYLPASIAMQRLNYPPGTAPMDERISTYVPGVVAEFEAERMNPTARRSLTARINATPSLDLATYLSDTADQYVSDDEFAKFYGRAIYISNLLRSKNDGVLGSGEFKKWLPMALQQYRTKVEMQRILHANFRSFFDSELKRRFREFSYASQTPVQKELAKLSMLSALKIPYLALGPKMKATAKGMLFIIAFSSLQTTWNALTSAPQTPINQLATQLGNTWAAPLTVKLQGIVIDYASVNDAKKEVAKAQEQTKELAKAAENVRADSLVGMDPNAAEVELKRRMEPVKKVALPIKKALSDEITDYNTVLKYGIDVKTLDDTYLHQGARDARGSIWHLLSVPMDHAIRVANVETNYNTHLIAINQYKDQLRALDANVVGNNAVARAQIVKQIAHHEARKQLAMQQLASVLALIDVFEFLFPETLKATLKEEDNRRISGAYLLMKSNFGYDHYLKAYQKEVERVVLDIHRYWALRNHSIDQAMKSVK